jgi:predicted membrane protein
MDSFLFSRFFWGIIVVLLGIGIIVNAVFKINFPVFRVLLALFFIYLGVKMLIDIRGESRVQKDGQSAVFSEQSIEVKSLTNNEYKCVFSDQRVDLRDIDFPESSELTFKTVFGSTKVFLPRDVWIDLNQSAVFGTVKRATFSEGNEMSKRVKIKAEVVFGEIDIIQ